MTAERLVEVWRMIFGSRLVKQLEKELLDQKLNYEQRLADKTAQINELKGDRAVMQARILQLENVVLPLSSRAGADLTKKAKTAPDFGTMASKMAFEDAPKGEWQAKQDEYDKLQDEVEKQSQTASAK